MPLRRRTALCAALLLAALGALAGALALPTTAAPTAAEMAANSPWTACSREVRRAELAEGIPAYLLSAISQVEAGRWSEQARAKVAWPWTVGAAGKGRYFPTKAEAAAEIRRLRKRGIKSIDVGCMQINLLAHPKAFANAEEALDPTANTDYAARLLKELRGGRRTWQHAVAYYHSSNPKRHRIYLAKVMTVWHDKGQRAILSDHPVLTADAGLTRAQKMAASPARALPIPPTPPIQGVSDYLAANPVSVPEVAELRMLSDAAPLAAPSLGRQLAELPALQTAAAAGGPDS